MKDITAAKATTKTTTIAVTQPRLGEIQNSKKIGINKMITASNALINLAKAESLLRELYSTAGCSVFWSSRSLLRNFSNGNQYFSSMGCGIVQVKVTHSENFWPAMNAWLDEIVKVMRSCKRREVFDLINPIILSPINRLIPQDPMVNVSMTALQRWVQCLDLRGFQEQVI